MPDKTLQNLLAWIESEIKETDKKLDKADLVNVVNGHFARIRKMRIAKEVINEFLKTR